MIHELKTEREYFVAIFSGIKKFEVRKNDRDFKMRDELLLKEYLPEESQFTGRILHRRIDYVLYGGQFGIEEGYCVMSLRPI